MQKLIDINQLSETLSVKKPTIYGWISEGIIPHYKVGGRLVRFDANEVMKWLDENHWSGKKKRPKKPGNRQ